MEQEISKETYNRLYNLVGKPEEYLSGKVCTYDILNNIDRHFLHNIEKEFLKDYFLIKDWKHFSFYNGSLFEKIFKEEMYKNIPLENLKLMWYAFNENKKEINTKNSQYYQEKRYQIIPDFAKLVLKKSKNYNSDELLLFLKEIYSNLNEDLDNYYQSRNAASLMGEYLIANKEINQDIFDFLKKNQSLKNLDFYLIYYDWQISKMQRKEKIHLIFTMLDELKPEISKSEIIKQSIEKNAFQIIKYIHEQYDYIFEEKELEDILKNQKGIFKDNVQYMIENFQPSKLVGRAFTKVYSDYKFSVKNTDVDFYNQSVEFLKKKINYEDLQEKLKDKNKNTMKSKIKKI